MTIEQGQIELSRAAEQVRRRIGRNAFLDWLWRGRWLVPAVALALVLILRLGAGVRGGEWIAVLGVVVVYAAAGAVWCWMRRPRRLSALAVWDEKSGRKDQFSSAWAFLNESDSSTAPLEEGRKLHILRALKVLPEALKGMAKDLPAPQVGGGWLAVIAVLIFAFTPWLRQELM